VNRSHRFPLSAARFCKGCIIVNQPTTEQLAREIYCSDPLLNAMGLVEQASELVALACGKLNEVPGTNREHDRAVAMHDKLHGLLFKIRDRRELLQRKAVPA